MYIEPRGHIGVTILNINIHLNEKYYLRNWFLSDILLSWSFNDQFLHGPYWGYNDVTFNRCDLLYIILYSYASIWYKRQCH